MSVRPPHGIYPALGRTADGVFKFLVVLHQEHIRGCPMEITMVYDGGTIEPLWSDVRAVREVEDDRVEEVVTWVVRGG